MADAIIAPSRISDRVDKESAAPCWLWTGRITEQGYGVLHGGAHVLYTHRVSYELHVGPIPEGLHIDHLCRNRACCNPEHLEPVTCRENVRRSPIALAAINARKTHCDSGHEFTPANTNLDDKGNRSCRACRSAHNRVVAARRKRNRHRKNTAAVIAAGGPCLHASWRGNVCTLPQGHDGLHCSLFPLVEVSA